MSTWILTDHAIARYAEIRGIEISNARSQLEEISNQARFVKILPSKFLLYRYNYSRSDAAMSARKANGKRKSKRSNLGLVVSPTPHPDLSPILVTVLWRNPYRAKS